MFSMCLLCSTSGLLLVEGMRRGHDEAGARRRGWILLLFAVLPAHLAAACASVVAVALGHGALRGFGSGVFITSVASAIAVMLLTSLSIRPRRRAATRSERPA